MLGPRSQGDLERKDAHVNPIVATLLWQLSLFKKVFIVSLGHITLAIGISITARIARLLSVLLPLKAILVAGSDHVPSYILSVFPNAEIGTVVVILCIFSVIFYMVYLLSEQVNRKIIYQGARRIVLRVSKISTELNVFDQTFSQLQLIVKSQSSLIFVLLLSMVLLTFYGKLVIILLCIIIVPWMFIMIHARNRPAVFNWLYQNRKPALERSIFVAIMATFFIIVIDTLHGELSSVILAVIAFILSRQVLNSVAEYIKLTITLQSQQNKINNLFFHSAKPFSKITTRNLQHWPDLTPDDAKQVCCCALQDVGITECMGIKATWREGNIYNTISFDVNLNRNDDGGKNDFLVKLYNNKLLSVAAHEVRLLKHIQHISLPSPKLLGQVNPEGYDCIVMECPGRPVERVAEYTENLLGLLTDIWSIRIPRKLSDSFMRSISIGIHALNEETIKNLLILATDQQQQEDLQAFIKSFQKIMDVVISLPLALYNPEISMNTVAVRSDGRLNATHWGRWSVEPIGTALWNTDHYSDDEIENSLSLVSNVRPECGKLLPDQLRLAGHIYRFWKYSSLQKYSVAMKTVPLILECFNSKLKVDDKFYRQNH